VFVGTNSGDDLVSLAGSGGEGLAEGMVFVGVIL